MTLICSPDASVVRTAAGNGVLLFGRSLDQTSTGALLADSVRRRKLSPSKRAWDLLSIALSVTAADLTSPREASPDGWTREIAIEVAVHEPDFWTETATSIQSLLNFLTTDAWTVTFRSGGFSPQTPHDSIQCPEDSIVLLSGGLDSLVGSLDLAAAGKKLIAVSQTVRGDAERQAQFAQLVGAHHMHLNHATRSAGADESSQRGRSLLFLAMGVLAATSTARHHRGERVTLYVCENGFIAINPPLTGARLGSLSTRTAHPRYLGLVQRLLDLAGLNVVIENPYTHRTKGEMLVECANQSVLRRFAHLSTSCGRFQRFGYRHCGRCVPCMIRRAAFVRWDVRDRTSYVYKKLGKRDSEHAGFDDVRASAMAIAEVANVGVERWLGPALASLSQPEAGAVRDMLSRGLTELAGLHAKYRVR